MKIVYAATYLVLHVATCLAVLNKVATSNPKEAATNSEAKLDTPQASYQYSVPTPQYLPTNPQQGFQYVVPVVNHQPQLALVGSPIYQHTSATQALAVDVGTALPNRLPTTTESETYFVAHEPHKDISTAATDELPRENVNPGYAPPVYHSANYYVPRQTQRQQQQLLSPQVVTNTAAVGSRPQLPTQDHEHFAARPDQRDSNGESQDTFTNTVYTSHSVASDQHPQYIPSEQFSNGYGYSKTENCATSQSNFPRGNDFPVASEVAQTTPDFSAYQHARPIYHLINHPQLITESRDHENTQTFPHSSTSNTANSQNVYRLPVKSHIPQTLSNSNAFHSERPAYQPVSSVHTIPADHQRYENVEATSQAIATGSALSQTNAQMAQHGYIYRPSYSTSTQINSNDLVTDAQQNSHNYVQNTVPANYPQATYDIRPLQQRPQYLSPLHTQIPMASIAERPRLNQTHNTAAVPNYALNHKGLGHYSYTQSNPVALTANDELLTGEQLQPEYLKPSTGGRDYLQMQSQSYELPTYSNTHTDLPVATDYAQQRIQGSQSTVHFSSNQPPLSGLILPQVQYGFTAINNVATPVNKYLPPSGEVKSPYL